MSKKLMMLAAGALTALAFAALPAVASAGTPQVHCPEKKATCSFTIAGVNPELKRTDGLQVGCSSVTGSGVLNTTGATGVSMTFHGCKETIFNTACTTSGQSSGTIKTGTLSADNIYTTDNKTSPGILMTPPAGGHFATFSCIDGTHTIDGPGIIGSLTAPACGGSAGSATLNFGQSSNGHQTHKQITGTGAIFDLTDGGTTASMVGTGTITPSPAGTLSITCV